MYPANPVSPGDGTRWTYTAPSNTSISAITALYAGLADPRATSGQAAIQLLNEEGALFMSFNDRVDESDARSISWSDLETHSVTWRMICDPSSGAACAGSVGWAALYEPHLYLADHEWPKEGPVGGTVTTDERLVGDENFHYSASDVGGGLARLRLYVDGVQSVVDHVIDDQDGRCRALGTENGAWVFSRPRPCPLSVEADETIDTTRIPDGPHFLRFDVVDAAQHETELWSDHRTIANHPPVNTELPSFRNAAVYANPLVGTTIEALGNGTWSGPSRTEAREWRRCSADGSLNSCVAIPGATGLTYAPTAADLGHRLRFVVTSTNPADKVEAATAPSGVVSRPASVDPTTPTSDTGNPAQNPQAPASPTAPVASLLPGVAPVPAVFGHELRGRVEGAAGCPQDKATLRFEHVAGGKVKLSYGKASAVQLQLTCTNNGKPIEAAHLDVATRVGSGAAVASDVVTDGAGHATLRLSAGTSRSVAVGYRMYSDDPIARTTASLKVAVNGRVRLRGNHRRLRNGRALTLRGRLLGGHVPRRGVNLTVQWKDRHRWRPFAQIKANKKGTFSYAYRFTRTRAHITYTLRVQVSKGQLDYPFQPVASNAVKVTVGP